MRLALIVLGIAVLGVSLGVAHTWSEFSGVEERFGVSADVVVGDSFSTSQEANIETEDSDEHRVPKVVVVGATSHDFGVLAPDQSNTIDFVVKNEGNANLLVEKQNVSCGLCVQTTFTKAIVNPGQEIVIQATLTAKKEGPQLSESLEIRTNDKQNEVIRFDLLAYIAKSVGASVRRLTLGDFSTEDGTEAIFHVYGFVDDSLKIETCDVVDSSNKSFFEVELRSLTKDEVEASQSYAKCGKEVKVIIKPGLPIGPVKQSVEILVSSSEDDAISIPVSGTVTGDIFLIGGSKYTPESSLLSIGRIAAGRGASVKMHLMVKGQYRESVEVTVGVQDPESVLSATVGEKRAIRNGESYLIPITVEIAKDAPKTNRLGGVETPVGEITLETTHPTAKQVRLRVRFAVE